MNLPEITIQPTELFHLQYGTIRSWLLITAVELKVFSLTVEKKTAPEITAALNTHGANTELFLNALCSLGLLRKENGAYMNTELSETFLVEGRETYLGGFLLMNEQWNNIQSREQMKELVKNGPMSQQNNSDYSGDYFAKHVNVMRNFARSGVSQFVAKEISSLPEFSGMRKMLELGGAHGLDTIAMSLKNPALSGVVFDKPAVVKVTQQIIAEYEMEERITVMGGDYATDPIGSGYDLIYAKATLSFFKDNFHPVFEKIYKALNPDGVFVSVHDGLTDESTKPEDMVISWLSTSLSSCDFSLRREVIPNAMLTAGFKTVQTMPFSFPLGEMDMVIGRK
jgi:predicted O-methyltransferase YrrM